MAKILIIDDEIQIVEQVSSLVTSFGHTPLYTLYGSYLFQYLQEEKVDLILLDIYMPEVSGLVLLKQLKEHKLYWQIPVIILTGESSEKLLEKCFASGASDFINKPIQEVILRSRIHAALDIQDHIQQLNKLNNDLKLMQAEIVQAAKLKGIARMATGIAHEINNPLCIISMHAEKMISDWEEEQHFDVKGAKMITDLVQRCSHITHHLLRYSRDEQKHQVTIVPINQCIENVLMFVNEEINKKEIRLQKDLSEGLPSIKGDLLELEQAFRNIVLNSMDALENQETKKIEVRTSQQDAWLVIEIKDTGCGIAEENMQQIMEPFYTTKDVGGGPGLGLSVSYGIIKNHQGSIHISSELGKGTLVTIKLPQEISNV